MDTDKIEVLHNIEIPGGDTRWPVSVQVERRTTQKDGTPKTYINLVISIGAKKLFVPRRVAGELAKALEQASLVASDAYTSLLETGSGTEAENIMRHVRSR